ncbi:MAG: motility protein A [Euryarchaeota archaeon]|nr:motility protein A [Candidatus Gottesmanbacteria bacterium]MBM4242066.1 motility protein A [Euryarchaeota archaeon]
MDIATIIGIIGGLGCIAYGILQGAGVASFIHIPSLMITLGGTIAATLINFPLPEILKIWKTAINVFKSHGFDPSTPIPLIISYAEKSRQEGLLSLEDSVYDLGDEFFSLGMRLIIDGTDPEQVRDIMEIELAFLEERHSKGQRVFTSMAKYSPAFGMIGTLIGLISMLKDINDPSTIGPSMAVALITTFYGSLMANLVFMPIAGKLKTRTADEVLMRRIILEGILMIQAQVNPRYINQKLIAFLPPTLRKSAMQKDRKDILNEKRVPLNA